MKDNYCTMKYILIPAFILFIFCSVQSCTMKPATPIADDETILDAYWMLISLEGEKVPVPQDNRMAYIRLQERENDVIGFTGCNKLSGKYKLTESALQFSEVASTRMSCPNLETENKLLDALRTTTKFQKSGSVLTLYAGNKAVATFKTGNPDLSENRNQRN